MAFTKKHTIHAQQVLDHDHNGFISVREALEDHVFHSIPINLTQALTQNITTINRTVEQLKLQYNVNNDTFISINDELKPRLIDQLRSGSVVTQNEKCGLKPCPIWLKSQYSAIPNLDIISKVPFTTSILILNASGGPIESKVLEDLYEWLGSHSGFTRLPNSMSPSTTNSINSTIT